jgi:hypothetical protein
MAEPKTRRRRRKSSSSGSSSSAKSSGRSGASSSKKSSPSKSSSSKSSSSAKRSSAKRSSATSNNSNNHSQSAREIVIEAVRQLQELIGRPVESVTGIEKDGREWKLSIEVLEMERVPNTTDVLGKYDVTVDHNGELTGARRTRRYPRAEAGED